VADYSARVAKIEIWVVGLPCVFINRVIPSSRERGSHDTVRIEQILGCRAVFDSLACVYRLVHRYAKCTPVRNTWSTAVLLFISYAMLAVSDGR
jgi:hypothetical protein